MPIDIVVPLTPTGIGPGAGIIVRTSMLGPFPTDWTWRVEIHPHGDEDQAAVVMTAPLWTTDQHDRRFFVDADPDGGQQTFYGRFITLNTNDLVDVQMQLIGSDGVTIEDSGTVTNMRWDTQISASKLLPVASSGLTSEQAEQLAFTQAAVTMSFPGLTSFGLSDLLTLFGPFAHPPIGLQTRELIGDFDGNVAFDRPAPGIGVNAFGLSWEVQTYGGGIGLDAGTPLRFEVDLLELSLDHTNHDGHEYTSAAARFDYSNGLWYFDPMFPTRVNVSIAPSVTIRFWWILATFP